ncbi:unnamed protein product, partial [Meganyctiphanes norvegica]
MTVLSIIRKTCSYSNTKIVAMDPVLIRNSVTLAAETKAAVSGEIPAIGRKWVGRWLFGCSGMVFGAVVIGGLTRLTESGLSMTDWHLFGKRPPWSRAEWEKEFAQYQQYPEYQLKNKGMTLEEFKFIWWMEYGHRQWGRTIGTFFLFPAAYFWHKGWFNKAMKKRVFAMGALIGFQGLLGWYMVKSGLEDRFKDPSDVPRVSQYRLSAHLGSAFVLYSLFLWNALEFSFPAQSIKQASLQTLKFRKLAHFTKGWVFLTALSGNINYLIHLHKAKKINSMLPMDFFSYFLLDIWSYPLKNVCTLDLEKRVMGTTAVCLATALAVWSRRVPMPPRAYTAANTLGAMAWMQVGLGISTLLLYVPVSLAAMHQSGSLLTLSFAIWLTHELKHLPKLYR